MNRVVRHRMPAEERRAEILQAAISVFARTGFHGTSTEAIAERAGVSQPYLFRLFGTKLNLFLAAADLAFGRVEDAFRLAAERAPDNVLEAMGKQYRVLLQDRDLILLQLQAYSACSEPEIRDLVRRRFAAIVDMVRELSGAPEEAVQEFFAYGMLVNVAAAMDLVPLLDEEWVRCLLGKEML